MGDKTGIEWTDATWNPVTGCTKVSQGCKHCYAERVFPRPYPGRAFTDVRVHHDRLDMPLRWRKPRRIFVNSMSDLFHEDVTQDFIERVFVTMARAPQHTFQVLTKRPDNMLNWFMRRALVTTGEELFDAAKGRWPLPNVWLGVSVEDQATADERIPLLLQTPAAVRWISAEPLLGSVDLTTITFDRAYGTGLLNALTGEQRGHVPNSPLPPTKRLDWVVVGGESGPKARPMHPIWAYSLRTQCETAAVPFLFKQWGEWVPVREHPGEGITRETFLSLDGTQHQFADDDFDHAAAWMDRVGKRRAGRRLEGLLWNQYPTPAA